MKKRLEADLISIAHRILKIKNKSDINQLYLETQKLYEKLSVLRFIEENYGTTKPTIDYAEMQKEIEDLYDRSAELPVETVIEMTESNVFPEASEETVAEETATEESTLVEETAEIKSLDEEIATEEELATEEITENLEEEILSEEEVVAEEIPQIDENLEEEETVVEEFEADIQELQPETKENDLSEEESQESITAEEETPPAFKAAFELMEDTELEVPKQAETMQISFADLLGGNYSEPHFVKVDDVEALPPITEFEAPEKKASTNVEETKPETAQAKNVSLNDKLSKGIDIDLNDRIAFVKHLFGNSTEDYNRVLNQLITFDNFYETKNFIEEMVKPDYNDWKGKDDYAERFMDIIEKKFL